MEMLRQMCGCYGGSACELGFSLIWTNALLIFALSYDIAVLLTPALDLLVKISLL